MALTKVSAALANLDGAVVINESSADVDFRIESDDSTHMLFVDGGNDRVGINEDAPQQTLSVGLTAGSLSGISLTLNDTDLAAFLSSSSTGEVRIGGVYTNYFPTFYSSNSEAMRITTGGTVLIGKTALDNTTDGVRLNASGIGSFARDGVLLYLNRKTSNGDAIEFAKDNTSVGGIGVDGTSLTFDTNSTERIRIDSDGGVGIGNPTATNYALEVEGAQIGRGSVYFHTTMPLSDATYDLGHSSYRWRNMYLSGTTYPSDRNQKNTIVDSDLGLDFINRLSPVSYKYNNGTSGRTHYGLISQDVEDVLSDISKTGQDFAGFCKDEPTDPPKHDKDNPVTETRYGLRYTEFIAPMIKAIQEQQAQIEALQSEINTLKGE